jgi:hypothetical protein
MADPVHLRINLSWMAQKCDRSVHCGSFDWRLNQLRGRAGGGLRRTELWRKFKWSRIWRIFNGLRGLQPASIGSSNVSACRAAHTSELRQNP